MSQSLTQVHREFPHPMPAPKRQKTTRKTPRRVPLTRVPRALKPQATQKWVKKPKDYVNFGYALPKRVENTHRYFELSLLNPAAGVTTKTYYRANGMFDPSAALGGHQPMLFDQMSALYNHFTVIESRITVVVAAAVVNATSNNGTAIVVLSVDDNASDTRGYQDIIETDSNCVWGVMTTEGKVTLSTTWKAADYFGGDVIDNPNFRGSASADPTEQSTYVVTVYNSSGSYQVFFDQSVFIEYRAVWSELKDVVAS